MDNLGIAIVGIVAIIILSLLTTNQREGRSPRAVCVDGIVYFESSDRGRRFPGSVKIDGKTSEPERCK